MNATAMLDRLAQWQRAGWLRSLDVALARFVHETDPASPPGLLLAAALTAQMEGQGHGGLPLDGIATLADEWLGWPPEGRQALHEALVDAPVDAAAWQGLSAVEIAPRDVNGASPLVLDGPLLFLRRTWLQEKSVAAQVLMRAGRERGGVPLEQDIDLPAAQALLARLFPPVADETGPNWQAVACALALRGRLTLITGGPGTGKTFTAARLLVLLQSLHRGPGPLRVALAAPTGKAAARLRQSISQALQRLGQTLGDELDLARWAGQLGPARTLHALLGRLPGTRRFRHDAFNPLDVDLLFVDEASMVHLEMMARLLEALPAGCRVVLLGDKDQLASVEAGAVMADLCHGAGQGYDTDTAAWVARLTGCELPPEVCGAGPALAQQAVVLRRSHRFDGPIGALALAVNAGQAAQAQALLQQGPSDGPVLGLTARNASAVLPLALQGRSGAPGGYRRYLESLSRRPRSDPADRAAFEAWVQGVLRDFDTFRVLCAVREGDWGVAGLNRAIEQALAQAGWLTRRGEWYEGRPVMVTRNDPELGLFNGDIGIVLRGPGGDEAGLRAWFADGEALHSVSVARLAEVETAFAMTVHKSQGSEFDHVALVLPEQDLPVLTRELVYTGITRARSAVTLVGAQPALLATAVGRLTRRVSGLRGRL